MNTSIYDKTAKGREEIATRKYQLAPRMRTLLLLIDGRKSEEELLRSVAGLGLTADSIAELQAQDYVVLATSYSSIAEPELAVAAIAAAATATAAPPPVPKAAPAVAAAPTPPLVATPAPPPLVQAAAVRADVEAQAISPAQQFQSVYEFYNKTIKSNIGLRGFTLQLKVEKAASVDELRDLRRPYLEAVLKAKGSDIARTLAAQLDQLLGNAPSNDSLVQPYD